MERQRLSLGACTFDPSDLTLRGASGARVPLRTQSMLVLAELARARGEAEIEAECIARVRKEIGPVAAFRKCLVVDALPKTRSGKILRGTMVSIADGTPWKMPATIDDASVLYAIAERIGGLGEPSS